MLVPAVPADAGGEANPGVPAVVLAGVAPKVGPGDAKEKLTPLVAVLVAAAVGVWTGPGVVAGACAAPGAVVEAGVPAAAAPKLKPPPPTPPAAGTGGGDAKLKPDIGELAGPVLCSTMAMYTVHSRLKISMTV